MQVHQASRALLGVSSSKESPSLCRGHMPIGDYMINVWLPYSPCIVPCTSYNRLMKLLYTVNVKHLVFQFYIILFVPPSSSPSDVLPCVRPRPALPHLVDTYHPRAPPVPHTSHSARQTPSVRQNRVRVIDALLILTPHVAIYSVQHCKPFSS